jgi:hypothetical protein
MASLKDVAIVEKEKSVVLTEHGWKKRLVSVGGWPHKYIYAYENAEYHVAPLSNGEWQVYRKKGPCLSGPDRIERNIDVEVLLDKYKVVVKNFSDQKTE